MPSFTDQLHNTIHLSATPKRIISLVPSQTELLYDLGLSDEVIGITKFCVHPTKWFNNKTRIGGTKNINIEKIKTLQPDLIIANKEENVKEQIEAVAKFCPVWVSDINNLADALTMIESLGMLTNKAFEANNLIQKISSGFAQLPSPPSGEGPGVRCCYLIWKNPYITIGGDTFINDMLQRCGLQNVFADNNRYPEIYISHLKTMNCQLILLSSEPYPFKQKHIDELKTQIPNSKFLLVDGEMFSWYGSRLLQSATYFQSLIQQINNHL